MADETPKRSLDLAKLMQASAGVGVPVATLDATASKSAWWMPTGLTALDRLFGDGVHHGIGGGRMYNIYGVEGTGKSLVCFTAARHVIENGGVVVYVDMERTVGTDTAIRAGVDASQLVRMPSQQRVMDLLNRGQTFTLEDAFHDIEKFVIEARKLYPDIPIVVLYDSVAASSTRSSDGAEYGKKGAHGDLAKSLSQGWRQLRPVLSDLQVGSIWINQLRVKQGINYGDPSYQPGGMAARHYPDSTLRFRRSEFIKEGAAKNAPIIGEVFHAQVEKNRIDPGRQSAAFRVLYTSGIDDAWSLVMMGEGFGIVSKAGAWYSYGDVRLGQGIENSAAAIRGDADLYNEIRAKILTHREGELSPFMTVGTRP